MTPNEAAIELQRPIAKDAPLAPRRTAGEDIAALIRTGKSEGLDAEGIAKMLDVYERIADRNARQDFNAALAALQAEAPRIQKTRPVMNRSGGHMYNYANRSDIMKVYRPLLVKHGFSSSFSTRPIDGQVFVVCTATHVGGGSREAAFPFGPDSPATMTELQKRGSGLEYAKRYAFCEVFDIDISDDHDGGEPATPADRIGEDDVRSLNDALIETNSNKAAFCKMFGVIGLSDLTTDKLDAAWAAIEKKRAKAKP